MSSLEEELEVPYPPLHEVINDQPCMSLSEVQNTQDMQVTFDTTAGAVTQLMRGIVKNMRATGVTIPAAATVQITEPQQLGQTSLSCQPLQGDGGTNINTNYHIGMMMRKSCLPSSTSGASPDLWQSQFTGAKSSSSSHPGTWESGGSPHLPSHFVPGESGMMGYMMMKSCLPSSTSGASPGLTSHSGVRIDGATGEKTLSPSLTSGGSHCLPSMTSGAMGQQHSPFLQGGVHPMRMTGAPINTWGIMDASGTVQGLSLIHI